jgi:hypothetical protein
MDWEKLSRELNTHNWVILLILGLLSFYLADSAFTLGIILGGLMIIANFRVLEHTVRKAFCPDGAMMVKKKAIIAKYYLRLLIMGVLIYVLVTKSLVNPIGLAIGLSTVVISILTIGIHRAWKQSNLETI